MNFLAVILQSTPDVTGMQQSVQQAMMVMVPVIFVIAVLAIAIILIPFWFICKKAGFSPWLTLLNLIPLGNVALIYVLAFGEWKVIPISQLAPYPPLYPPPYQPPYPPYPPQPPTV